MTTPRRPRVAILISGRGTNMEAILAKRDEIYADFVAVISSSATAKGLQTAQEHYHLPTFVVDVAEHADRAAYDDALHHVLQEQRVDFIVLAGFMRILTDDFVRRYPHRIVNIHPSLLPSFPGLHAQRQALRAGVKVSGCTVHVVVPGDVDGGPIIGQAVVPVYTDDDETSLAARIQKQEHRLYPAALHALFEGRLFLRDGHVHAVTRDDDIPPC